jgi:DNA-binding beta-propeller fold protein YncE
MNHDQQAGRTRVGGRGNGRWAGLVALLGAGLLALMVSVGTIDPPPSPTATPRLVAPGPSPTPSPAPLADELLYLVRRQPNTPAAGARRFLEVIESSSSQTAYTLSDVSDVALSADGRTVYVLFSAELAALDASSTGELWRVPLNPPGSDASEADAGSWLAMSADGRTILVLRQQVDGRLGRQQAWVEQRDSATGAPVGRRVDLDHVVWSPTLLAGAPGTALLFGRDGFSAIDLDAGAVTTLLPPASGPTVAALEPRQSQIYVANGDNVVTRISRFDPAHDRRSAMISLDLRPSFGPDTLAAAPGGGRVAMVIELPGAPMVYAGHLTQDGSSIRLVLIDPTTGTIVQRAELPEDSWITNLAFSADGALVYFAANSRLYRWRLADNTISEVAFLRDADLDHLLVGPAVPDRAPPATPTAGIPVSPTPRPTPPPLTQPGAETVAWLWPVASPESSQNVVAYAADGSAQLVADRIDMAVARPGQPPLLLREVGQLEWQIIDPGARITATVQFSAPPRPLLYADNALLLSPSGDALAFLANDDLIATDALTAPHQLVLVDVRSGALRALAGLDGLGEQLDWPTAQWTADGIFVFSQSPAAATVRSASSLWRIDPAADQPRLERELAWITPGAYASLNAAARLVLYQPYTEDPYSSSLRLADLSGGSEQIVMESGPFINSYEAAISPDGGYVAYLRPLDGFAAVDLVLYDVATRRERVLLGGMNRSGGIDLQWSGQHSLHLLHYDNQPWLGVVADDVWEIGAMVPTRPQRRLTPAWPWFSGRPVDANWLDRRRFASLTMLEGYALLRRISLDPAPAVDVALPLPAWPGLDAPISGETAVIYAP